MKLCWLFTAFLTLASIIFCGCTKDSSSEYDTEGYQSYFWFLAADSSMGTVELIDITSKPPKSAGTFLAGQLGSVGGQVLDLAITTDGKHVLISNFGDCMVYRINIENPHQMFVDGSVNIGFFAEDIAIAPNGRFALVTDGGVSPRFAIIALPAMTLTKVVPLTLGYANAVAIASDNTTIVMADYFQSLIVYGALDPDTGYFSESVLPSCSVPSNRPVNIAISPDGTTVLAANEGIEEPVAVFTIVAPGVLSPGITPFLGPLPGGAQSIAFHPNGKRAYIFHHKRFETYPIPPNELSYCTIHGPGDVTLDGISVAQLYCHRSSSLFGVDTIAVTPDGAYALATMPSLSGEVDPISLINLENFQVTSIKPAAEYVTGVVALPRHRRPGK